MEALLEVLASRNGVLYPTHIISFVFCLSTVSGSQRRIWSCELEIGDGGNQLLLSKRNRKGMRGLRSRLTAWNIGTTEKRHDVLEGVVACHVHCMPFRLEVGIVGWLIYCTSFTPNVLWDIRSIYIDGTTVVNITWKAWAASPPRLHRR